MNPGESQNLTQLLEKFSAQNPDIYVAMENVNFFQAQAKFEQGMKAGVFPDLLRADRFWIPLFVKAGFLEEISADSIQEELEDLIPIARQAVFLNDKYWGLPSSVDCLGLFYNKAQFKETKTDPPLDLESFQAAAEKNTDPTKGKYGFFMNPAGWWFETFLFGFGGRYYDSAGKSVIHSDQTLKAVHFLVDLKESLHVMPPVNLRSNTYELMMQSFRNGQVSMIFNGPWAIREILEGTAFKDKTENLGVGQLPKGPGGRFSPIGCQTYVIPKGSKNRKQALELMKFLCSTEVESALSKLNFGIPARKSLFSDPELSKDPFLGPFMRQIQESQTIVTHAEMNQVYAAVEVFLKKVLNGDLSPEDALKDLETGLEKK